MMTQKTQSVSVSGSHAFVFKSLHFDQSTLKCYPRVFKLKLGLQHFQKSPFSRVENSDVVWMPGVTVAKLCILK